MKNQNGFTLLELIIVLSIIGVLAGVIGLAVNQARVKGRDAKRAGDMRQMITAFDQYYIAHGTYPTGTVSTSGSGALLSDGGALDSALEPMIPAYIPLIPVSPSPADGSCNQTDRGGNAYWYDSAVDGTTYTLTFCLGKGTASWPEGIRSATPEGVK